MAPEPASGWRSPPRSPRVMAGRSRWRGPPKAASWSVTACQWQVNRRDEQPIGEMSRRAFILATAVLAAGCIRSEPGGRVRLAAGDPGRVVSGVRGDSRETGPGPLSGHHRRRARHRGQLSRTWPACASGDVDMGLRSGRRCRAGSSHRPRGNRTPRGSPGVRELSAGDRARLRCRATAFRPSGNAGLHRRGPIRRRGDQRGAVRGGRPSRSSGHADGTA